MEGIICLVQKPSLKHQKNITQSSIDCIFVFLQKQKNRYKKFYYFVKKISFEILRNGIFENLFNLAKGTSVEQYKIEQHLMFSGYNRLFVIAAYLVAFMVYNFVKSDIAISVLLAVLSLTQIISTILIVKSDKLRAENK